MEVATTVSRLCVSALGILLVLPLFCYSQENSYRSGKATFYEMPDGLGTPGGACGYGEYGRTVNGGDVAAVSTYSFYKSGARCGACYRIKCKQPECNREGVKVVVTDSTGDKNASFILNAPPFSRMAIAGREKQLRDYGSVNVKYIRIRCDYAKSKNLEIKVLEHSSYPYYLSFVFLYQGGNSDITAVEVFKDDTIEWKACDRSYGAVWKIANPPNNTLTFRLFLPGSENSNLNANARWVLLPNAVPASWKPGVTYDTSVRIS